jgi:hypothetical protein
MPLRGLMSAQVRKRFHLKSLPPQGWDGKAIKEPDPNQIRKFVKMRDQIKKCLDEAVDNPRHFEKVQWFVTYWTRWCVPIQEIPALQGLEPISQPPGFVPETRYFREATVPKTTTSNKPTQKP